MKQYSELIKLSTFKERYLYLRFRQPLFVGQPTKFRWLNQRFYQSNEWRQLCRDIVIRDGGCDLGISDRPIFGRPRIHHINPLTLIDFEDHTDALMDPENLICVSHSTHNAIHFGNDALVWFDDQERRPNDTCPWKEA